jgi:hypothetical protein
MPDLGSWDFWAGVIWGASVAAVFLYHWLIRPMGRLLGFEDDHV